MTQSGRSLAGKQCPRAHSQQRINYRECQKKARKHTSNGERNQYRRDEDQSVDDGSNNELSRSRATTKEVKPSDDNDGQTDHAHKCLLMARERRFPEDYLYCTRPSD